MADREAPQSGERHHDRIEDERLPGKEWGKRVVSEVQRANRNLGRQLDSATGDARKSKHMADAYQHRVDLLSERLQHVEDVRDNRREAISWWQDPGMVLNKIPGLTIIPAARIKYLQIRDTISVWRLGRIENAVIDRSTQAQTHRENFDLHESRRRGYRDAMLSAVDRRLDPMEGRLGAVNARIETINQSIGHFQQIQEEQRTRLDHLLALRSRTRNRAERDRLTGEVENARRTRSHADLMLADLAKRHQRANQHLIRTSEAHVVGRAARRQIERLHGHRTHESPDTNTRLEHTRGEGSPSDDGTPTAAEFLDFFNQPRTPEAIRDAWNTGYDHLAGCTLDRDTFQSMLHQVDVDNYGDEHTPEEWKTLLMRMYGEVSEFAHLVNGAIETGIIRQTLEDFLDIFIETLPLPASEE